MPDTIMTEVEKLALRHEEMNVTKSHASWTTEGSMLSEEEKAKILNDVLDQVEEQFSRKVEVPVVQMMDIYEALLKLSRLGQATVDEWSAMTTEEVTLRIQIRKAMGMSLCLAGNWLSQQDVQDVRDRLED